MPRLPIVRSNQHYYHLCARSNGREHFYLDTDEVWDITSRELRFLQVEFHLQIPAFVLMDNHFHLLMLTPTVPIDRVMYFFMKNVTKKIQKRSGRINKVFGGRYRGCLIEDQRYFLNAYKYVLRNPVAANLVKCAEDYPYSTLYFETHQVIQPIDIEKLSTPTHSSDEDILSWLNSEFENGERERVKYGLSKSVFQLKKKS